MRWSQSLIPTLKETPAEAEIDSHKLLLRAGLVRKLSGGLYTFLPLGLRVLQKISTIIRAEMNRAGAQEVLMPALQPPEIWQKSGRYETASEVFFRAKDRANKEWILGPTHEEVITTLVAGEINSYRQLPCNFYQIQTKFRDEIRPRFGLMRAKEFIMKDAYSFDVDDEASQLSYQKMYEAYATIFRRCGLKALPVEADTGVMGGKFSHEFMVPAEIGENQVMYCDQCGYAANDEKADARILSGAKDESSESGGSGQVVEKFATPGVVTIEALTKQPYSVEAMRQIKTLVYVAEDQPVLILMRGDHTLNESKLVGVLGTGRIRPATAEEIVQHLGAHPGSLGAVGVEGMRIIADLRLKGATGMTTGANEDGFHLKHVSIDRDIKVKDWADVRLAQAGDGCPRCEATLKGERAIEVGHVFKLGTKYSEALGAFFLDQNGKQQPSFMGCYGIGVTRTMQAVIEQSHDKDGIIWPLSVAPYQVCLTVLDIEPEGEVMLKAREIYEALIAKGVEVIMDDRDERPGVKFKDSELIGFPIRLAVGARSLAKGEVEIKVRGGELESVTLGEAVNTVVDRVRVMD